MTWSCLTDPIYHMLAAIEGDKGGQLWKLPHWPDHETVNNMTVKLNAEESVWRDYYTGQRLENWTKPWVTGKKDAIYGDTHNCLDAKTNYPWNISWEEWECHSFDNACPCQYPRQPLLRLRGLCKDSAIEHNLFTPKQLKKDPDNLVILGKTTTRIMYIKAGSHWRLTDAKSDVTAVSRSSKVSYVLGKHNWTVSNDAFECSEGKPYVTMLKLTGCDGGEFTCNDGQCIRMGERCNQVPNCRDKSDEKGCQLIALEEGYNKNIPPIERSAFGGSNPTTVVISMVLMKVVDIDEVDHSIHLQFQISLKWRENPAKFKKS